MSEISDLIKLANALADEADKAVAAFDERQKKKKRAPVPTAARAEIHDG